MNFDISSWLLFVYLFLLFLFYFIFLQDVQKSPDFKMSPEKAV